jgi:hypothetical protein
MITIIESPNNWQNLYNEIVVGVSGSNSTQPNFQFLCDVNVSGQTNPVTRLTYPKQPLVGTVKINVGNILKNYVTYDFSSFNTLDLVKCANSEAKYWLEFGEIYDVSGVPAIFANQAQYGTSGSPKSGSNAIFDFLNWSKTAFSTSKLLSEYNTVSLNDNSYREKIRANQQRFLTFFSTDSSNIVIVDLVLYNSQGAATFSSSYSTYTPLTGIVSLNIGDTMLDFFGASGFMSSSAYYRVDIRNSGDEIVFTKTIDIDNSCTQFTNYRLHWLNSMGGFDAFNFNMVSTERIEIDTKEFKKVQQLGYAKTDRLKTKYYTKFMESVTLNSDLLSDAEYAALEELVLSPVVMLETSPSTYVPVNVVANNYVKKKYEQGRTIPNMELTIQYSFDNYRQSL